MRMALHLYLCKHVHLDWGHSVKMAGVLQAGLSQQGPSLPLIRCVSITAEARERCCLSTQRPKNSLCANCSGFPRCPGSLQNQGPRNKLRKKRGRVCFVLFFSLMLAPKASAEGVWLLGHLGSQIHEDAGPLNEGVNHRVWPSGFVLPSVTPPHVIANLVNMFNFMTCEPETGHGSNSVPVSLWETGFLFLVRLPVCRIIMVFAVQTQKFSRTSEFCLLFLSRSLCVSSHPVPLNLFRFYVLILSSLFLLPILSGPSVIHVWITAMTL